MPSKSSPLEEVLALASQIQSETKAEKITELVRRLNQVLAEERSRRPSAARDANL